jgi:UDP-N-acetylmuramoyl-L-alanyl-D-glutamate--2,6-diaminopimelate ligase
MNLAAPKPLRQLLADVAWQNLSGDPDVAIAGMTHDSRAVLPGVLFVAYQGVTQDVHRYIPDAVARGAAAVLVERPVAELTAELGALPSATYIQVGDARLARGLMAAALWDHPSRHLAVVGVTGTDGKTTTATLAHAMLQAAGRRAGLITTVSARIGSEELDTGLHVTTPEAEDLQAYLAAMLAQGSDSAVVEVTSHGLAQHRVAGVAFDVAVLTNITHEALEYHGTFEAYRQAKAMLFHALAASPRKPGLPKTSVLNRADPAAEWLSRIPVDQVRTYNVSGFADYCAEGLRHTPAGLSFTAATPLGRLSVRSPLLGSYNAANILAAMAASAVLGAGPEAWSAAAAAVEAIPGRMERVDEGQAFTAIVDFAHTVNGLRQALSALRELAAPGGRVLCVFGCAGLRDATKRPLMGRVAGELADITVVTAEDPRTEDLSAILAATVDGLRSTGAREGESYHQVPDRFEAITLATRLARPGDVVIVCGKGHEQSMCFGGTEHPWDDREALRAALGGRRYGALPTAR